jgi:hypothetical protein
MASSARSDELREREEERRLNLRTLVIASAASATAAAVTSQLWIHGTWIAAALTPALVALLSEAMHRPTARIARAVTADRPALRGGTARQAVRPAPEEDPRPGRGAPGPVRVYRQPSAGPPRRRLALGAVAATAVIAFIVGVLALTTADLVSGGSVGKGSGRTTLLGGDGKKQQPQQDTAPEQARPEETTEEQPPTTTDEAPPTTAPTPDEPADTAPVVPPESPPGEPAPDAVPTP